MSLTQTQIVNLAIGRLIKQGTYGADINFDCCYITHNKRCVVGILLAEHYAKEFEHLGGGVRQISAETFPDELRPHIRLLERMQYIHDGAVSSRDSFPDFIMNLSGILETD